jgi:NAD+ synthase
MRFVFMNVPHELEIDPKKAIDYGISWVRDYFSKSGFKTAVIGISGGSDSAFTAYITSKAIGKSNVVGVMLPEDRVTPEIDTIHAKELIKSLGINSLEINLTDIVRVMSKLDPELLKIKNRIAYANVKARLRMVLLYKEANKRNALVVGTDDRSEHILGYYTKYGDGGVDINVPEYLYKTQLRGILEYIALKEKTKVMKEIADKKPSPQLWEGQTAEGELDADYQTMDRIFYYLKDYKTKLSAQQVAEKLHVDKKLVLKLISMEEKNKHKDNAPAAPPINYSFNLYGA